MAVRGHCGLLVERVDLRKIKRQRAKMTEQGWGLRGDHYKFPILAEVLVKGKGCIHLQPLHQGKGGAIRKAEPFVMVAYKNLPCSLSSCSVIRISLAICS